LSGSADCASAPEFGNDGDKAMRLLLISLATIVSLVLSGCINSPALPLGAGVYIGDPGERPEEELVGVVNGVWKYDPARARSLMEQYDSHLSEAEIATYSQRYMVRVGIKKMRRNARPWREKVLADRL
jgi:hypothetical protein